MSGVLHRLAALAMGSGGTVRAAARPPFSAAPDLVERRSPIDPPSGELAASPQLHERTDTARRSKPPTAFLARDALGVAANSEVRPEAALGVEPRTEVAGREGRPEVRSPPGEMGLPPQVRMRAEVKAEQVFGERPTPGNTSGIGDPFREMPPPILREARFPESLLPAQAPSPSVGAVARAWGVAPVGVPALSPSATPEQSTDVHVTIGRIELTAIHEAPRAKPPKSRAAPPMTLDEYLARRRGGRR